ncbi:MAG: hypothetical protein K8T20_01980 [Planctomycetes bacterium]|nr:hypothetical protein [Planctomycetota bacterium]
MRRILVLLSGSVALSVVTGCGFGIAGAGWDSDSSVLEAMRYWTRLGEGVSVVATSAPRGQSQQHVGSRLSEFPNFTRLDDGEQRTIETCELEFSHQRFTMRKGEVHLIDVQLPSIFYMHGLEVGSDEVAGRRIWVISSHSRATTGLVFVGIYGENGEILFDAVLRSGEVWDIQETERGIAILGADSKSEVVLPEVR